MEIGICNLVDRTKANERQFMKIQIKISVKRFLLFPILLTVFALVSGCLCIIPTHWWVGKLLLRRSPTKQLKKITKTTYQHFRRMKGNMLALVNISKMEQD